MMESIKVESTISDITIQKKLGISALETLKFIMKMQLSPKTCHKVQLSHKNFKKCN